MMFVDQVHPSLLWRHAQFIASIHVALVLLHDSKWKGYYLNNFSNDNSNMIARNIEKKSHSAFATFSLDADEDIVDLTDMKDEPFFAWEGFLASLADMSVIGFKVVLVQGYARESLLTVT